MPSADDAAWQRAQYECVCESYHRIDDIRMKLLGLLPLATIGGLLLALDKLDGADSDVKPLLAAIGAFGFLITLGLFVFELHGINQCHHFICTARRIEARLGNDGQFLRRPEPPFGRIDVGLASSLIYATSLAAWVFLAFFAFAPWWGALSGAVVAFGGCFAAARRTIKWIRDGKGDTLAD